MEDHEKSENERLYYRALERAIKNKVDQMRGEMSYEDFCKTVNIDDINMTDEDVMSAIRSDDELTLKIINNKERNSVEIQSALEAIKIQLPKVSKIFFKRIVTNIDEAQAEDSTSWWNNEGTANIKSKADEVGR